MNSLKQIQIFVLGTITAFVMVILASGCAALRFQRTEPMSLSVLNREISRISFNKVQLLEFRYFIETSCVIGEDCTYDKIDVLRQIDILGVNMEIPLPIRDGAGNRI